MNLARFDTKAHPDCPWEVRAFIGNIRLTARDLPSGSGFPLLPGLGYASLDSAVDAADDVWDALRERWPHLSFKSMFVGVFDKTNGYDWNLSADYGRGYATEDVRAFVLNRDVGWNDGDPLPLPWAQGGHVERR